jgi:two-component system cell cycle sensor histidine kinase/response regulator CckA
MNPTGEGPWPGGQWQGTSAAGHLSSPPDPGDSALTPRDEYWSGLFEQSEHAQLICRRDGTLVEFNARAEELLGLSRWVGAGATSARRTDSPARAALERAVVPPVSRGLAVKVFQHLFSPSVVRRLRELIRRQQGRMENLSLWQPGPGQGEGGGTQPDGPPKEVSGAEAAARTAGTCAAIHLLVDLEVTPLGKAYSLVTLQDSSRARGMESLLQRLATAINSAPDVMLLTDPAFRLTFANASFHSVTGYTIEEALGRPMEFLCAPGEWPRMRECQEFLRRGGEWTGEFLNARADGSTYPVEAAISPIHDKFGQLLGYAAIERDITFKKHLQEELQRERDYALSIIDSLDAAVYTLDREFRLTHRHDGWRKFPAEHGGLYLRQPPQVGTCLLEYVPDEAQRAELKFLFTLVLVDGQPQELEMTSADKRHWHVKIAPWKLANEIVGLLYVVTDQTRLHELQRQLFQAQKMETIGTLAAGVAHDFNNLLLAIRGHVGLLQMDEQLSAAARGRLEKIAQAATRAADITKQLLTFSRPSEEQEAIVDLNEVIHEAGQLSQRSLRANVALELRPAQRPMPVRLDATRAQQLLLNLCVNAQDAMPQGGRLTLANSSVRLSPAQAAKHQQTPGADFVRCTVADTGTGIPPAVLPRIFDPFFTTKGQGKGTGLGLSIVHSIVTHAGGFIEVESQLGQGTAFHIFLPRAEQAEARQPAAAVSATAPPAPRAASARPGRVLVVDDLDLVLDFTKDFMEECGYEVLVASSAEQAVEVLEGAPAPVDVVFTDYNMTGKTGLELIKEVSSRWPRTKFILVSGYLEEQMKSEIERQYPARVLAKPFTLPEATDLIAEMLREE